VLERQNRVRAEMLLADAEFVSEEESHHLSDYERENVAIRWICRVVAVFAQSACCVRRPGIRTGVPLKSKSVYEHRTHAGLPPARFWRTCVADKLCLVSLAEALSRAVPDADCRVIL